MWLLIRPFYCCSRVVNATVSYRSYCDDRSVVRSVCRTTQINELSFALFRGLRVFSKTQTSRAPPSAQFYRRLVAIIRARCSTLLFRLEFSDFLWTRDSFQCHSVIKLISRRVGRNASHVRACAAPKSTLLIDTLSGVGHVCIVASCA